MFEENPRSSSTKQATIAPIVSEIGVASPYNEPRIQLALTLLFQTVLIPNLQLNKTQPDISTCPNLSKSDESLDRTKPSDFGKPRETPPHSLKIGPDQNPNYCKSSSHPKLQKVVYRRYLLIGCMLWTANSSLAWRHLGLRVIISV